MDAKQEARRLRGRLFAVGERVLVHDARPPHGLRAMTVVGHELGGPEVDGYRVAAEMGVEARRVTPAHLHHLDESGPLTGCRYCSA